MLGLAQDFDGGLAHLLPVGFLGSAELRFGFAARERLKILEGWMVSEVFAAWLVSSDGIEQIGNVDHGFGSCFG